MNHQIFTDRQICRWNAAAGFELDGQPIYIVGINYVARHVCTNFWEDWRPKDISADFDAMAALGVNAVRIPIHWEFAEPKPGKFRKDMMNRLDWFVAAAHKRNIFVMPWFLVGVATREYDVSWRAGRSFFTEPMVSRAENHLRAMVRRLKRHENILCWDICDEPEWYSRNPGADQLPYDTERFHAWVERLYRAIKKEDKRRAVTLGFGHIVNGNYGMNIRRAAKTLDVMAVTAYAPHADEDLILGFRSAYFLGWSVRFNDCAGKGVFTCEAPGWSDIMASEENIGKFHRVMLFSNLANGAMGVMPWVFNDFDDLIQDKPPMDLYTSEKKFGIMRLDGTPKPAAESLREFSEFVGKFPPAEWEQILPEAGILAPVIKPTETHREFSRLFHHYIFLRQAGLRARYVWADDLDDFKGKLLFLPDSSASPLLTGTWLKLKAWVERGGTLVSTSRHTSSIFNELFGVKVEGRINIGKDIVMQNCRDEFAACKGLVLPRGSSFLLVSASGGRVMIRDREGRALAVRHELGKGRAFFMAYAPEAALASVPPEDLGRHGIHAFFRAFTKTIGKDCPVSCHDPRIELDVRRHSSGRLLVILINHSRFPVKTKFAVRGVAKPIELEGNGVLWRVFN